MVPDTLKPITSSIDVLDSVIAARKVHVPLAVAHTPSPGSASEASPRSLTTIVAPATDAPAGRTPDTMGASPATSANNTTMLTWTRGGIGSESSSDTPPASTNNRTAMAATSSSTKPSIRIASASCAVSDASVSESTAPASRHRATPPTVSSANESASSPRWPRLNEAARRYAARTPARSSTTTLGTIDHLVAHSAAAPNGTISTTRVRRDGQRADGRTLLPRDVTSASTRPTSVTAGAAIASAAMTTTAGTTETKRRGAEANPRNRERTARGRRPVATSSSTTVAPPYKERATTPSTATVGTASRRSNLVSCSPCVRSSTVLMSRASITTCAHSHTGTISTARSAQPARKTRTRANADRATSPRAPRTTARTRVNGPEGALSRVPIGNAPSVPIGSGPFVPIRGGPPKG